MSASKAYEAVLAYLAQPFNAKARKSMTPSPRNMRNNGTKGFKELWYKKNYFIKVVKKNGHWIQDPNNKKHYIKVGGNFIAPKEIALFK